jgi:hypothetical protein
VRKNVTFSAEKELIRKARLKAQQEQSTLNEQFRQWLKRYVNSASLKQSYKSIIDKYAYANSGRSFNRVEMNER